MKELIHRRRDTTQADFPLRPRLFLRREELKPQEEPDLPSPLESTNRDESGGFGWTLILLIGIPLPVFIVVYFLKGSGAG